MKKNQKKRNLVVLLILAIISLVVLLSSFAKYTGIAGTSNSIAKVAKWSVTLDGDGKVLTHTYTKNLVPKDASDNYIIAPGVDGSYEIQITNAGDVAATVTDFVIAPASGNASVPMQYSVDGTTWTALADAVTTLKNTAATITINPTEQVTLGTLYWKWPYTAETPNTDKIDTDLGTNSTLTTGRSNYELDMTITATQVAPAK